MCNVLSTYFDKSVNQSSPVQEDVQRVSKYDEKGNEIIHWNKVDYPKIQAALGTILDWSLNSLLKAGIDPSFPISTGINSRVECVSYVEKISSFVDTLLSDPKTE